jgi:hypothetical protein
VSSDISKVLSSTGACEPFTVTTTPKPASILTTVKRDVDGVPTEVSNTFPAPAGATVYDTAVVDTMPSGLTLPTGSKVQFNFFTNNTCEGTPTATASIDIGGQATAANVGPALSQGPVAEGNYSYIADFVSGDVAVVLDPPGTCEPFAVSGSPPASAVPSSIVTTVKRDVDGVPTEVSNPLPAPAGATVYDTAVVDTTPTGVTLPSGSAVQFSYFTNNTCSGTPLAIASVDLGGSTTAAFVGPALQQGPLTVGEYSYRASFTSGDIAVVLDSAGACEPFKVSGDSTTSTSNGSSTTNGSSNGVTVRVGGTAVADSGLNPGAYQFYTPVSPPEASGVFPPLSSPSFQGDADLELCARPNLTPEQAAWCFASRG